MTQLITHFKPTKLIGNIQGLVLDKENATTFEINAYIAFLTGRIQASDVFSCRYDIHEFNVSCYTVHQTTELFPNYNDHTECYLLLSHHNIATVYNKNDLCYTGAKLMVNNEGEVVSDTSYLSDSESSKYLIKAGLFTLINVLESDNIEKIALLKKEQDSK